MSACVCGKKLDLTDNLRRIAGNNGFRRNILGDHAAGSDYGARPDSDATHDGGIGADGDAFLHHRGDHYPVGFGLELAGFVYGAGVFVVDEHDTVADKCIVFDGDAFADKGVTLDLAAFADVGVFLDLDKGANTGVIVDGAAV